jgi:hypothetical protein
MATEVTVPMVGKIISVQVKEGDQVNENDQIATLEAMKMEMPVVAPVGGVVKLRPVRRLMPKPSLPSSNDQSAFLFLVLHKVGSVSMGLSNGFRVFSRENVCPKSLDRFFFVG